MPRVTFAGYGLLVALMGGLWGCDAAGPDDFTPEVVVSAVLIADAPLPRVRLVLSGPIDEPYDERERSVDDGEVLVQLDAGNGEVVTYEYRLAPQKRGVYWPPEFPDSPLVVGGATYRFRATVPGFPAPVTAETIVPESFAVTQPPADTIFYQVGDSPRLSISPTAYPGRQNVYVFNVMALDPDNFPLTPFAADLVNDRDVNPIDLEASNSPLLNEENYTVNPDGTISIGIIWLAFNYFGPQRVLITSVDDALLNFIQSQTIQFIPTTLSPGEIPNVVTNVLNGGGVFGAVAQAEATTFLAEAP